MRPTDKLDIELAARRLRSPVFPSIAEALEKRQRLRETIAARTMLVLTVAGLVYTYWDSFGWVIAGFNFLGFVITCFVAGNRHHVRTNGGRHGSRPF